MLNVKLKDINFCAIDLETTGVNPAYNKIVEIGAVKFNLSGEISRYQSLVNPEVRIPNNVIRIHGITDDMVSDSPVIEDLLNDFSSFMKDTMLVIQNPRFDLSFIDSVYRKNNRILNGLCALDTVKIAKKHFKELPNHKLGTLAKHLKLNLQSHRALDDAIACMHVFCTALKGEGITEENTYKKLLNFHGQPIKAGIKLDKSRGSTFPGNISIGKEVIIKYMDSSGNVTKRHILPKEFIKYGKKNYILAHCFLRGSERCFMTKRIIAVD